MNKSRLAFVAATATAFVALALALPAPAAEMKLAKKDVPAPVLEAFAKTYPNAKALAFAKETEKGKTYFEIESRDGEVARDLQFAADGTIVEVEETVKESELPATVIAAVKAMGPGVSIRKAEKVTKGSVVTYSLALTGAKVKEVELNATGTPVKL